MTRKSRPYREVLLDCLAKPEVASAYLNAALEDSQGAFLKALQNVAQAHQVSQVAREAGVQRETLYRSLSENGNPTLETLTSVLSALGMELSIIPKREAASLDSEQLSADVA